MDRLAHYSILDKIGEGGMGQVFRARDEQLGREVAIKLLPEAVAGDPERLARFEREARLLATLNHPGIAAIYGMHEADGVRFLAMEYVPGEDLAKRLARGPLPVDEALRAAARIAEALESAHEKGVVHRDLKPANVIVDEDSVKILDFGLAKMLGGDDPDSQSSLNLSNSPTRVVGETVANVILGTAAYMSPEQARGRRVDRRTDVWAFGCLLYEMLTGRAAYGGETVSDTIGAVLHVEPDWSLLPAATPASVRTLLRRCLEKDRAKRLRDAGDALLVIQEALAGGGEAAAPATVARHSPVLPIAAAVLGAAIAALAVWLLRPAPAPPPVAKFVIPMRDATSTVYLSPDGSRVAWFRDHRLLVRSLDELDFREIDTGPGTPDGGLAWSPDGSEVAFVRDGQLWKVPVRGGPPVSICRLPGTGQMISMSWGRDGHIAFASWRGGLYAVNAEGGAPDTLIAVNQDRIVDFHSVNHLPDGSLLFDTHVANDSLAHLEGLSRWTPSGTSVLLPGDASAGVYSPTGHLLYIDSAEDWTGRLMAAPFSVSRMQVTGPPFRVADHATRPRVGANGTLAYTTSGGGALYQATWFDRDGRPLGTIGDAMERLRFPALSPDGSQLAVTARVDGETAIWIIDVETGARRRLTFAPGASTGESGERFLTWSPDGKNLVFARSENLRFTLYELAADGTGNERRLFAGERAQFSRDGRYLVFNTHGLDASESLWLVEIAPGERLEQGEPRELIRAALNVRAGHISPDGRFIAFELEEAGRSDVFLAQFPSGEGRWQISTGGGREPRWSPDGRTLYFADDEDVLYEVPVQTSPVVNLGRPRKLFGGSTEGFRFRNNTYTVTADGRFLMVYSATRGDEGARSMVIVQNWREEFRGRK